ncbi:MAG: O-methyltransferase [Sedimentisphaerales bacterium]|nr:O-methyltransferase [Sedimentisphaerales bacterium]
MAKRIMIAVVGITLLTTVGLILAQEGSQGGGPGYPPRMGPQGGPMGPWLDDLERAYEQKDMDRIGELIRQMRQRRQQFQGGPGGPGPGGPPERMRGPGGRFGRGGEPSSEFTKAPVPKNDAEKAILAVLNEMDRSQRRNMMNVPSEGGRFLRLTAESIGAKNVVEVGTSNGYSAIWQCLALKTTGGKLTTFEIDAERAALARENFKKAGVADIVTLVEGDAHEKITQVEGPVDMAFIDADKEGYLDYLNKLLPKMRPGGLILAHNISAGMADSRYIEAITTNPDIETLFFAEGGGFSVTLKKRDLK